jgi:hypothetical protein
MADRRKFSRKSGFRDSKLIVIAAEGRKTEKIYFDSIKEYYQNPRVHVEVLERIDSSSDPDRVLKSLDQFYKTYDLRKKQDQLWLVIDVDRWGNKKLASVSKMCLQKKYRLAVSNPAFEIWLLMHIRALETYSPIELEEFKLNQKIGERTRLELELLNLLGSYNKINPDMNFFNQHIYTAILNSQNSDCNPEERWPNGLGTRVYLLAREIVL